MNDEEQDVIARSDTWVFGGPNHLCEQDAQWWKRHEPIVDRWLSEMELAKDPWSQSAEHAAFCLVSSRELDGSWDGFAVCPFLFRDLMEGGSVGVYGSTEVFFDQLLEALQRFVKDGLIDGERGEQWLAEMQDARGDFLRCYDQATTEREALAIVKRRCKRS